MIYGADRSYWSAIPMEIKESAGISERKKSYLDAALV